jgi:hypothetical protein
VKKCVPFTCGGGARGSIQRIQVRRSYWLFAITDGSQDILGLQLVYRPSTLLPDLVFGVGCGDQTFEQVTEDALKDTEYVVGVRQGGRLNQRPGVYFGPLLDIFIYDAARPASNGTDAPNPRVLSVDDWRSGFVRFPDTYPYYGRFFYEHFVESWQDSPTDEIVALSFTGWDGNCGSGLNTTSAVTIQPVAMEPGCPSPPPSPPSLPPAPPAAPPAAWLRRGGNLPAERGVPGLCEQHGGAHVLHQ